MHRRSTLQVLGGLFMVLSTLACGAAAVAATVAPTLAPPPAPTLAPTAAPAPTLRSVPTIAPTATPTIPQWPVFQNGDWDKPEVFALQRLLRANGVSVIADGLFGRQTQAAVINFQSAKRLPADGKVGPVTWPALVRDATLQEGQNGDAVRALQVLLISKFSYSINADGIFGPDTAAAVKAFQSSHGLPADGVVGMQTWQALVAFKS